MSSSVSNSPDADDPARHVVPHHPIPHTHPGTYSAMPMHMYPFSSSQSLVSAPSLRSKRRQVKNACTNCQKACKKCDDARPCLRCVKYGISEECVDSQRKERRKGVKRGPYKKRDGKGRAGNTVDPTQHNGVPTTTGGEQLHSGQGPPTPATAPAVTPFVGPTTYLPPGYPSHYPPPPTGLPLSPPVASKSAEVSSAPAPPPAQYFPQFYIVPPPVQDNENHAYSQPNAQYYQGAIMSAYPPPYPLPYMMHARPDVQGTMPVQTYAYPTAVYSRSGGYLQEQAGGDK